MRSLNVQDLVVLEETVQENRSMLKKFCEGELYVLTVQYVVHCVCVYVRVNMCCVPV